MQELPYHDVGSGKVRRNHSWKTGGCRAHNTSLWIFSFSSKGAVFGKISFLSSFPDRQTPSKTHTKHKKTKLTHLLMKSTDLCSLLHASALWWRYLAPYTVWWGCVEVRLCCWPIQWCRTPHWGESQRRCGCVAPSSLTRHLYGDTTHTQSGMQYKHIFYI